MGKIHKLSEELIRLIAAGEVIERPASVLKELVENSLDANATQIAIDIWGAGRNRIRVSDNGPGIKPGDIGKVFQPHYTTKNSQGTGMGLYLSYQIVEVHRGLMDYKPGEGGKGSTFVITFPKPKT